MTPKEVEAELRRRLDAVLNSAQAAVYQGASIIMTEAKKRAPLDLGTLRNSGYVTLPRRDGDGVFVEAGFGGAAKAYAVRQHEESSYRHEVGEAFYLQNAIDEKENAVRSRILKIAKKALETGISTPLGDKIHEESPSETVMPGESRHQRRRGDDS